MENIFTLNSGQKIEVLYQNEVTLDIASTLTYIKSGEKEIETYVENTSKPQLNKIIVEANQNMTDQIAKGIEKAADVAKEAAAMSIVNSIGKVESEIDNYVSENILPDLNSSLASAQESAASAKTDAVKAVEASTEAEQAKLIAEDSAQLAQNWAVKTDAPVEADNYSAKYYAAIAEDFAHKINSGWTIFNTTWSDHLLNDKNWLLSDTFSWQSGSVYDLAYNELLEEYNNSASTTETDIIGEITVAYKRSPKGYKIAEADQEALINSLFETTGVAWYYILDIANTQFKLPRSQWGVVGFRSGVGNYVDETLPNISGSGANNLNGVGEGLGAVQIVHTGVGSQGSSGIPGGRLYLDASKSSSAYQDGAPVQQRATQMYLYFYVGGFSQRAIEQTAGLNAELFNNKADINLENAVPAASFKEMSIGWGLPDYSAGVSGAFSSSYIAPAKGIVFLYQDNNYSSKFNVFVNDSQVWMEESSSAYFERSCVVMLDTGDVVTGEGITNYTFYPMKGVN